jgi:hypothetical protein
MSLTLTFLSDQCNFFQQILNFIYGTTFPPDLFPNFVNSPKIPEKKFGGFTLCSVPVASLPRGRCDFDLTYRLPPKIQVEETKQQATLENKQWGRQCSPDDGSSTTDKLATISQTLQNDIPSVSISIDNNCGGGFHLQPHPVSRLFVEKLGNQKQYLVIIAFFY